jgi:hypothetical protein
VVDERAPAVDLDHRQPFAVDLLELGIAADVDLRQLEGEVAVSVRDDPARPVAEVAALRVVEADVRRYG